MRTVTTIVALLTLVAGAQAARIPGTSGNDRLLGTPRADVMRGNQGRDVLLGLAGPDFLHPGPGRDRAEGGAGNDRVAASYDGASDTVRCGPGLDTVNADLADAVAADCELVGRRLARDPYTGLDGQHESQVEPDSLTVGSTTVAAFQVGRRFAGAAEAIWFSTSMDDGRTWRSGAVPGLTRATAPPGPNERATDPVVAYDAAHGVWLISTLAIEGQTTRLPVNRSRDGHVWEAPVVAAEALVPDDIAFDKNWIACDNGAASPFRGRCYIVYTDVLSNERLAVVHSDDGGLTWSSPVLVAGNAAVGAFPVIQPSGGLVVAYLRAGRGIGAATSTDGGISFGPPVSVADIRVRHIDELRFFPLPSADADPSGRVWIAWHECRFDPGCQRNSVVVASSVDGRAWSAPTRVTSGRDAYLPAVGFHPTNGRAAIVYHVVRPGGGVDVELVELAPRPNGGLVAAAAPRRLSARTMRPTWMPDTLTGRMLADYISVHYAGTRPLAVWVLASEPAGDELRQAVYATRG